MVLRRKKRKRAICSQVRGKVRNTVKYCTKSYLLLGRFGKILWKNIPEDVQERTFGIEQFANLCFNDTKHSFIFTTEYVYLTLYPVCQIY